MSLVNELKENIAEKDQDKVLATLSSMEQSIIDGNEELSMEVTSPVVITELHKLLTEEMSIPPRIMRLRARVASRKKRAILFLRAMSAAIRKVDAVNRHKAEEAGDQEDV